MTVQVLVPVQAPLQPEKTYDEDAGVAVKVTAVLAVKPVLQTELAAQLMPVGEDVTLPLPAVVTDSV